MRAIRIHEFGGIDTMRLDELPRPVPGAGEILVAVKAAGVGPWDRLVGEGGSALGHKLPLILGSDVSGTVAALGAGVGGFALGDAVYGATNDQFVGGYAEYALVEAGKVARKPAALDYVTAAGFPVVAVTAWQMLFEYARRRTRKHQRGVAPERDHRLRRARPGRGLSPVERSARGVFHRRRHARPRSTRFRRWSNAERSTCR